MSGSTGVRIAVGWLMAALVGCAGNGQGLDSSGRPLAEGSGPLALSADFNSLQANIFTPICSVCHAGATAPQGLRLDAANSYNLLVGIPSSEVPSLLRVKSGDPDNSYIIQKLEGHAAVGAQMPFGGPYLPTTTIAFIRQWISNGALRPAAAAAGGSQAFAIATTAPADGAVLDAPPTSVVVAMTRDLNASRVDTSSLKLEMLGMGDTPIDIPSDVALPLTNQQSVVVTPRTALAAGHYRIVVSSSDGNNIQSVDGLPLSGLPVDQHGDQIVSEFVVESR
jgi:hypothetical protein